MAILKKHWECVLLPFLLHNLLEEEVEEYNCNNPFDPVVDPSDECIGIVLLFIDFLPFVPSTLSSKRRG
jgi:hypothetical protein